MSERSTCRGVYVRPNYLTQSSRSCLNTSNIAIRLQPGGSAGSFGNGLNSSRQALPCCFGNFRFGIARATLPSLLSFLLFLSTSLQLIRTDSESPLQSQYQSSPSRHSQCSPPPLPRPFWPSLQLLLSSHKSHPLIALLVRQPELTIEAMVDTSAAEQHQKSLLLAVTESTRPIFNSWTTFQLTELLSTASMAAR